VDVPFRNHRPSPEASCDFRWHISKAGGVFHIVAHYKDTGGAAYGLASRRSAESNDVFTLVLQQKEIDATRVEGGV